MPEVGKLFPETVCLCLHNLQGKDNLLLVGILHIQIVEANLYTDHEYHLNKDIYQGLVQQCKEQTHQELKSIT